MFLRCPGIAPEYPPSGGGGGGVTLLNKINLHCHEEQNIVTVIVVIMVTMTKRNKRRFPKLYTCKSERNAGAGSRACKL